MIKEALIILVFSVNAQPYEISQRPFTSLEECRWFVNELAQTEVFINENDFRFVTTDGWTYVGQCISVEDYMSKDEIDA